MRKLKVDKSKIAGKGLFTTDSFEQGEMIGLAHENDQPTTFIGKYHNHSDEPNAVSVKLGDKRYLMAKRPLKKGEEITTNYRLQPELEQPEDFAKGGLVKMPKPSKQGLASKKFSKSLDATNRLFTENYLFSKPKSKKRKVFDPNAKYYQDGGVTLPEDYFQFQSFAKTLPPNLQDPSFEYGNPDQYDLYGMWETVGKPGSFADVQDSEYFPLDEDGTYHGFTVSSDGTLLKPMSHSTTWKEVMNSQLSTDPYFQENRLIRNEEGRLQYIPKAEYGMPMGGGVSQNYQGRKRFIHQEGGIISQEEFATGGVASPLDLDPETMKKYLTTLKRLENNNKTGYRSGKWYPHPSVEGGADTIAYGHKLLPQDKNLYQGITEEQANALQQQDVLAKQAEAKRLVDKQYGVGTFDNLPQDSQMLLVDYQYNVAGGLNKFPSFVKGVVSGDKEQMLKEYERGSKAGKLTARNNWTKGVIEGLDYSKPKEYIEQNIPLGNVPDATTVVLPQIEGPKLQEGGDIISQQGWDYMKEGDKYLTRRAGSQDWIEAQGKPLQAIREKIFQEAPIVAPIAPVTAQPTQQPASGDPSVLEIQRKLKEAGYDLGTYGPNKDGIDGVMGNRTKLAYDAYKANIPPKDVKVPKTTTKPTLNYTVNRNLPDGYLPVMQGYGQEVCTKDKGCSANVSIKMEELLGNIADGSLWANDAWFNKSDILNKGGDLIYDSSSKNFNEMGKIPKEVYSKLQVGDYVQLNRTDTASSGKFAAQTKPGLENEKIEHLGFVVGKDKDGTPLIWHGSETGKAFIKRIDEPITLDDHDKNIFTYKVSSIVRSPNLKDVDFSGLQNSPYYTPVDPNKKLVPKQGATETQVQATKTFNNSIGQFKNLGYSQEDANYVGQLLIGGIMQNETESGESWSRIPKEAAATVWKNYLGQGNFEGDEASVGYYQMKPNYNFRTKDGDLNPLGKKLQKLGVEVDDITSNNLEAQTLAGTLILLDNYKKLKENPDFDSKTNLYKGKIPASYILAKSWQAGSGWESREKYQKFLNDLDIDYSDNALNAASNFIDITEGKSIDPELSKLQQQQAVINAKKAEEARKKAFAEQQKFQAAKGDTIRKLPTVAESTSVNTNYTKSGPKQFNASTYIQQGPEKTVYTYAGRPGAMYKKDSKGNWYINLGAKTGNQFVKIQDEDGTRTALLNKGAVPTVPRTYKQGGGIYMELTDSEIEEFRRGGYIIEDLD